MIDWKCGICGFITTIQDEIQKHIQTGHITYWLKACEIARIPPGIICTHPKAILELMEALIDCKQMLEKYGMLLDAEPELYDRICALKDVFYPIQKKPPILLPASSIPGKLHIL